MPGELLLKNARVVTATDCYAGCVLVRDGLVVEVRPGQTAVPGIDLAGDHLLPGLVDIHTDNFERHVAPRPGVEWPMTAAMLAHDAQVAAAGITTVLDCLAVGDHRLGSPRPRILAEAVDTLHRARERDLLRADHLLHLRCELTVADTPATFAPYSGDSLLRMVSLMDHTPGQRQWADLAAFRRTGIAADEQVDHLIRRRRDEQVRWATVHRQVVAAMCRGRRLCLASHDDATAEHVAEALAHSVGVAEFPTTMVAARAARAAGMRIVMGAPNLVRGGSHCGNVAAAEVAAAGLLDVLASDYVPASLLFAAFLLHRDLGYRLPAAVAAVSLTPARMVGLDDRGEIAPGQRADLVWVRHADRVPHAVAVWRAGMRVV